MPDEKSIEGVILAAGTSFRAGTFKPALLIGGRPMLVRCVEGMVDVCGRIIVVGGDGFEQIRRLVERLEKVECLLNPAYRKGMFTSVKAGLAVARGERCFVLPGDIPLVPGRVYRQLLALDADIVVPAFQGRNGHPICVSKSVIPRILRESDDSSLRHIVRTIGYRTVEVDAEEVLLDVDTPQDYETLRRRFAE